MGASDIMTTPVRLHCIRPGCRRTAPSEKYDAGDEIVCAKCWRAFVPARLRHRYKMLNAKIRVAGRLGIPDHAAIDRLERMRTMNWYAIRRALIGSDRPAGLAAFLEGTGL